MQTKKLFVSIVIPAYNNYPQLKKLIASIQQSTFSAFNDIEIIIVDDGSTNRYPPILPKKNTPNVLISINDLKKNKGPAYARNYGVSKARGAYILFLDADVELKKNTLQNAYNFFKQKKGKAFTGIWDKKQRTRAFFPQFKALRDYTYWFIEREENARYYLFSTRIAGIEKKLFDKVGGFSATYRKATVEDIELTYKIEKYTKITFVPSIVVTHEFENFIPLVKKYFLRSRDWIKLYMKRLRFDPVATSQHEAKKSIIAGLFILCLFLSFFTFSSIVYFLTFILFLLFLSMELPFLRFLYKEKGVGFVLLSIPTALILYFIIDIGSVVGLVEYFWSKSKR